MTADPRDHGDSSTAAHRLPRGGLMRGAHGAMIEDDPTSELPPAYETLGPYRLVAKLGEGGMGVVHKGLDAHGTEVAIKVLRAHIAHDADARDRLRREVSTLARVQHESVAPVLDADVEGDRPYLVTRYVPGPPLDDVVEERGPLGPQQLVMLGRGLANALREIHAAGIVHRDLKPGNVLMVGDDPVLIDFGIAHVADDVRLTMTGLVMGTPGYLSPEVVEGAPVTESTDWWGWAATLAFAASGQAPFGRGPMPVVLDRVTRGQADLSGVDERLRPLLESALSPVPEQRPTADRVLAQMEEYAAGGHTTGIPLMAPPSERPITEPIPTSAPHPSTQQTPVAHATQPNPTRNPDPTGVMPAARPQQNPYASPPRPYPAAQPQAPVTGASPTHQADRWQAGPGPGPASAEQWRPPGTDPRIGQAARSWSLTALLAAAVGLAAVWPLLGFTLIVLWSIAARLVDRSMTAMVMRRYEGGRRRSDGVMAVVASPWHLTRAVLGTIFALLVPAFVGACAAVTTALALAMRSGDDPRLDQGLPLAVGAIVVCWVLWWGPGGTSMRRGSRSMVRGALPSQPPTQVVVALAVVIAGACAVWSYGNGGDISWWPMSGSPSWSVNDWLPDIPQR
ncbi:serine/threonine-protein kinase [Luteipulveratus flavus]|uniref:Protein kinase n=1 Tax=Luteipulveratus flavus TaxID=3031728 RepID=A0ABT6CBT0_9MICO|nr:serine/threonine protein kinase [Luteipulveratus sp. YIM 133296]MDF8266360.1 protein kinase [Luteipulveratus sp. YIM 133296]